MFSLHSVRRWCPSSRPLIASPAVFGQRITGIHTPPRCWLSWPYVSYAGERTKFGACCGLQWSLPSWRRRLPPAEAYRSFTGGKQKCVESAKEKRMRRILKRLNYATEGDAHPIPNTREWHPQEAQHQPKRGQGGEKRRLCFDSNEAEAEAEAAVAAAEEQMNFHLRNLSSRLKDLDVSRPKISAFEEIQVHVAGSNKRLSDLAQVQLKGNSVVILTLFSEQHLSKVISALRTANDNWRIVEEGPVTVRVQLPKMTEELRASFIAQAKAVTEEVGLVFASCKVQIRRIRQDARAKHRSLFKASRTSEDTRKNEERQLQKITDEAIKQAAGFLADRLRQLAAASC